MSSNTFSFSQNAKLAVRKDDKAVFQPSYPDDYEEASAIADIIRGTIAWYFRRIVPVPRRWWHLRRRWKRTGEIWGTTTPDTFDVVKPDEAWRIANGE